MAEAAEFWLDFLSPTRDGRLVVSPSYSPEHGRVTVGAVHVPAGRPRPAHPHAGGAVSSSARTPAFRKRLADTLERLDPGLRIGSWGQLQEWKLDLDEPDDDHRHVSHLYALHPGGQISPATTPELADAAKVTLRARGDGGTGLEQGVEDQLLGPAPRRRPCPPHAARAAPALDAAEPLGHPSTVPDRRQLRRDGGRGRDAAAEPVDSRTMRGSMSCPHCRRAGRRAASPACGRAAASPSTSPGPVAGQPRLPAVRPRRRTSICAATCSEPAATTSSTARPVTSWPTSATVTR